MLLGLGGDLKRLQLTIGFIAVRFISLRGIIFIKVFIEIFNKVVLSVLLHNYLKSTVETLVAAYRVVMVPPKDLLL